MFEKLLGTTGFGILQAALGVYVVLFGLGVVGQPSQEGNRERAAQSRPAMVVGGVFIILFGLWFVVRGMNR